MKTPQIPQNYQALVMTLLLHGLLITAFAFNFPLGSAHTQSIVPINVELIEQEKTMLQNINLSTTAFKPLNINSKNNINFSKRLTKNRPAEVNQTAHTFALNTPHEHAAENSNLQVQNSTQANTKSNLKPDIIKPTHIGGHLNNPQPTYPALSLSNEEQGVVTLRVMVEPSGAPSDVSIIKSSGYTRLDNAAKNTVMHQYHFRAATQGGIPIQFAYIFDIVFRL